ncbi:hypothetical protein MSPP1_001515 [Malassezia sp. CBS 17886]|nr:hypothetical protein MSPP1_001515 [Malassezia sp. CBS 17886]
MLLRKVRSIESFAFRSRTPEPNTPENEGAKSPKSVKAKRSFRRWRGAAAEEPVPSPADPARPAPITFPSPQISVRTYTGTPPHAGLGIDSVSLPTQAPAGAPQRRAVSGGAAPDGVFSAARTSSGGMPIPPQTRPSAPGSPLGMGALRGKNRAPAMPATDASVPSTADVSLASTAEAYRMQGAPTRSPDSSFCSPDASFHAGAESAAAPPPALLGGADAASPRTPPSVYPGSPGAVPGARARVPVGSPRVASANKFQDMARSRMAAAPGTDALPTQGGVGQWGAGETVRGGSDVAGLWSPTHASPAVPGFSPGARPTAPGATPPGISHAPTSPPPVAPPSAPGAAHARGESLSSAGAGYQGASVGTQGATIPAGTATQPDAALLGALPNGRTAPNVPSPYPATATFANAPQPPPFSVSDEAQIQRGLPAPVDPPHTPRAATPILTNGSTFVPGLSELGEPIPSPRRMPGGTVVGNAGRSARQPAPQFAPHPAPHFAPQPAPQSAPQPAPPYAPSPPPTSTALRAATADGGAGVGPGVPDGEQAGSAPDPPTPASQPARVARFEWMLGAHVFLYDEPEVENRSTGLSTNGKNVPLAWTFDDWYLEPTSSAHAAALARGGDDDVTAVVGSTASELQGDCAFLAVFNSALHADGNGRYVYDMGSPVVKEYASEILAADVAQRGVRRMPSTTRARMQLLFTPGRHVVLAATPRRLVAEMTGGGAPGLVEDVLLAYRPYFHAPLLLDLLVSRFEWAVRKLAVADAYQTAARVLRNTQAAMIIWLRTYYSTDFARDDALTRRFVQWTADQDYRSSYWVLARDTGAAPSSSEPRDDARPRSTAPASADDAQDPRAHMHALWAVMQEVVPRDMLPASAASQPTPQPSSQAGAQRLPSSPRSTSSLRKSKSLTRLFQGSKKDRDWDRDDGLQSRRASRERTHRRGASNVSLASLTRGPRAVSSPHRLDQADGERADAADVSESALQHAPTPSRIRRKLSHSFMRKLRLGGGDADSDTGEDTSTGWHPFRKYEPPAHEPLDKSSALDEHASSARHTSTASDATADASVVLQRLEECVGVSRVPAADESAARDGPIQWIPANASTNWKDAQRLSVLAAHRPRGAAPLPRPQSWAQRGSLLLCQHSDAIARQLTAVEKQLFVRVQWPDLTDVAWDQMLVHQDHWQREYQEYVAWRIGLAGGSQEDLAQPPATLEHTATHLLIARFNRACAWVATHIVTADSAEERGMVIAKWIRIAWHCYVQGNMVSLSQILFGLQSPWIARLQQSWELVDAWELRVFSALRRFTSPQHQFVYLRQSLLDALDDAERSRRDSADVRAQQHLPFFGIFVTDLSAADALATYVDTSLTPNMMPFYDDLDLSQNWDTMLNVFRLRVKAMIVRDFAVLQTSAHAIPEPPMEVPLLAEALQLDTLPAAQIQSYVDAAANTCRELQQILGCSEEQATAALQASGGSLERAMNRLLDMDGLDAPAQPAEPPAADRGEPPPYPPHADQNASDALVRHTGPTQADKRGGADDQDAELQQAVAASMQDQTQRDAYGAVGESEDEQLMRVLAESIGTGQMRDARADSAVDVDPSLRRLRADNAPVALVAPVPVFRPIALLLQALYAAAPARAAILALRVADAHVADLDGYWAGGAERSAPGSGGSAPSGNELVSRSVELVRRIQTLFFFMQETSRAAVVIGDVIRVLPRDVVLTASQNPSAHLLLEQFTDALSHAYLAGAPAAPAPAPHTVLQSFAAVARDDGVSAAAAAAAQPTSSITLAHTDTDTFVHACLWTKLDGGGDMDPLLITQPADVLLFNVRTPPMPPGGIPPFHVDMTIALDAFLWDAGGGARIDRDPRRRQLHAWAAERRVLEAQLHAIERPSDVPLAPLLQRTYAYFDAKREGAAEGDTHATAAWLQQLAALVGNRSARTPTRTPRLTPGLRDALADHNAQSARLQAELVRELRAQATDATQQRIVYDLHAVLLTDAESEWAHVRGGAHWWRIQGGAVVGEDAAQVCADAAVRGHFVFHLAYTRRAACVPTEPAPQGSLVCAVERDNVRARAECVGEA